MAEPLLILVWVVVAAAQQVRRTQEEEERTAMAADSDWEFKMMRSYAASFRKLETLKRMLAEEASAGWELHEKLDDARVRLRRRTSRRAGDALLGTNPYRTVYGGGMGWLIVLTLLAVLLIMLSIIWLSWIFA